MRRVISGVSQNSGFGENTDRDNDSNIRCIGGETMSLILDGLNLITHSVFEWRSPLWNWLHEFGVQETRYGKER